MFKVESNPNRQGGYKISIGTGKTYRAKNLKEVVYALEHYFSEGAPGYSGTAYNFGKHVTYAEKYNCCPFCKH